MTVGFVIKQLDLISQKPSLLINNSERIKSVYGAFLTILLVGFTLAFGVYFLYLLFGRINPQLLIYQERFESGQAKIYLDEKFPIFYKITSDSDENLNDYFNVQIFLNSGLDKISIGSQPCELNESMSKKHFLCLNYDMNNSNTMNNGNTINNNGNTINNNGNNSTIKNPVYITPRDILKVDSDTNNTYYNETSISMGLSFCNKNESCKITSQKVFSLIEEGRVFFHLGYMKTYFDIKNTTYPSSYVKKPGIIVQKLSLYTKYNMDLNVLAEKYTTDFGYILQELHEISFSSISQNSKITSEFILRNLDFNNLNNKNDSLRYKFEDPELIKISISMMSDWQQIYSRSFYTGQRFFAEIGGVFNFLFVITYHLNLIYSSVYFNLTVDNNCKLSYYVEKENEMRKLMSNRVSMKNHKVEIKEEIHTGMQLKKTPHLNLNNRPRKTNVERQSLNLNQIPLKKVYSLEHIDAAISDFRGKLRNMNNKHQPRVEEIIWRSITCNSESVTSRVYKETAKKIRDYLDVNSLIKMMLEFTFIKKILFSRTMLDVFKNFSDLKNLKEEKINEIHFNLKCIYENYDDNNSARNNNVIGEELVKEMDLYAAQFFIENYMK